MNSSSLSRPRYSFRFVMLMIAAVCSAVASLSSFIGDRLLGWMFFANTALFLSLADQERRATR